MRLVLLLTSALLIAIAGLDTRPLLPGGPENVVSRADRAAASGTSDESCLPAGSLLPDAPENLVSISDYDLDSDGRNETIEIVLVEGKRYLDDMPWCGMGDKWEGRFEIRVRKKAEELSCQSLNDLMGVGRLFFRAPPFRLVLRDYNQDGQIDFNLGRYAACNWYEYSLYTVAPDGRITRLDGASCIISTFESSTSHILMQDGLVGFEYYTQSDPPYEIRWYAWNGGTFEVAKTMGYDAWREPD